eukprot:6182195-Pleurochrysis_carterae.AAC.4
MHHRHRPQSSTDVAGAEAEQRLWFHAERRGGARLCAAHDGEDDCKGLRLDRTPTTRLHANMSKCKRYMSEAVRERDDRKHVHMSSRPHAHTKMARSQFALSTASAGSAEL